MAAATVSKTGSAQGILTFFTLSAVATGSTLAVGDGVKAWFINNRTTTDAVTATLSGSTLTITVANSPDLDVFIVK